MNYAVWIAILAVMVIVEAVTVGMVSIWFALGAVAALLVTLLHAPVWLQVTVFFLVSFFFLAVLYPKMKRNRSTKVTPTNADRILQMDGLVTQAIDPIAGTGEIRVDGKIWAARCEDGSTLPVGALVEILRIEGVRAIVRSKNG